MASGGHSSSWCTGFSLLWPLLLRSTSSRRTGSVVVAHRPSCSAVCGIFPDQGLNPCPLRWQADSQPLRHQGSPICFILLMNLPAHISHLFFGALCFVKAFGILRIFASVATFLWKIYFSSLSFAFSICLWFLTHRKFSLKTLNLIGFFCFSSVLGAALRYKQ